MGTGLTIFTFLNVWWLALFTMLPLGVKRVEKPDPGHSHGAPEKPYLKQKLLATTLIAAVITAVLHYAINDAEAAEYTVGKTTGCETGATYVPSDDVEYKAGVSAKGYSVSPADILPPAFAEDAFDEVTIDMQLPVQKYVTPDAYNADFSHTHITTGKMTISKQGVTLNGKNLDASSMQSECR